jgi:hypothetical protein
MAQQSRQVFRTEALRSYAEARSKARLLRSHSARTMVGLWAAFVSLLCMAGTSMWVATIPDYATGIGTMAQPTGDAGGLIVTGLLSADHFAYLQPGQSVLVYSNHAGRSAQGEITAIEPRLLSPDEIAQRLGPGAGGFTTTARPAAVFQARLQAERNGSGEPASLSGILRLEVSVGSHRIISFLPIIGGIFGAQGK